MMRFIGWLIFIKIVLEAIKKLKKIVIIEKDCHNLKRLQKKKNHVSNKINLVVI